MKADDLWNQTISGNRGCMILPVHPDLSVRKIVHVLQYVCCAGSIFYKFFLLYHVKPCVNFILLNSFLNDPFHYSSNQAC